MAKKPQGDIQCDPKGASPEHNRMLEKHGVPPEAIEDCEPDNQSAEHGMRKAIDNAQKRRTKNQSDRARQVGRERRLDERESPPAQRPAEQALDQSKRGLQDDN